MPERIAAIISDLMGAASNAALHSKEHPSVEDFCKKALLGLEPFFSSGAASFAITGYTLRFNDFLTLSQKSLVVGTFVDKLRRKGIGKVTIRKGVTTTELAAFVADLLPSERTPRSSPRIFVEQTSSTRTAGTPEILGEMLPAAVRIVKEAHRKVLKAEPVDLDDLEGLVVRFIHLLGQPQSILDVVKPHRANQDYSYVHAVRVSLLAIDLARAIGMEGDPLHQVGLAGLLFDVGRLFIPHEVLNKTGDLDERERATIQQHPLYGAMYLAALEDIPKLAVIAAFEHHMKFDGTGYPDTRWRDRHQHIVSQIVSLTDFFDALRAQQPYRKAYAIPLIVKKMQEGARKEFNPVLVQEFTGRLDRLGLLR